MNTKNPKNKTTTKPKGKRSRSRKGKTAAGNGAPVVDGMAEAEAAAAPAEEKETRADRRLREFYAKYPHVVADSVREPTAKDLAQLSKCHGKVCTVVCVEDGCDTERVINVQDAFQSKRCAACQKKHTYNTRKARRQARAAQRAEAKAEAEAQADAA
jgi:hypothetical protein